MRARKAVRRDTDPALPPGLALPATAYHEAGHAVVAFRYGKVIRDPGIRSRRRGRKMPHPRRAHPAP